MLDELRQIAIFAKTIDHGSFRGAAAELRLSPSVVSHHIAQLEDKLGVALIYRTTRRLTLTRDGEKLLSSARIMLDAVETGVNKLSDQSRDPSGELRVTLPSVLSQSQLIDDIAAFGARYSKVQLHLDFSDERQSLINDGYDLAIRIAPNRTRAPNRQSLFEAKRCLVAARSYLSEHPKILHPNDLKKCNWVEFSPARKVKSVLRKEGERSVTLAPKSQVIANNAQALYRFARAGAGVAIVPDFLAADDIAAGDVQIILPEWELDSLDVFAEWPSNAPKTGITRLLVSELVRL